MDNKYYTPAIEEFHVGFEYELMVPDFKSLLADVYSDIKWVKKTIEFDDDLFKSTVLYKNGQVRVKYLDKEDIESLGFEDSPDEPGEWFWKFKGNNDIELYYDDKISDLETGIGISIYNPAMVFSGYIKNKSELKVLLKQLEIQ